MPRLHESPEGVRWWPVRARGRAGCSHPHRRTMGIRVNVFTPSSRALPDPFLTPPYNRFTNWGCSENSREKRKIPKVPRHVGISYLCLWFSVCVGVGGGWAGQALRFNFPGFLRSCLPIHAPLTPESLQALTQARLSREGPRAWGGPSPLPTPSSVPAMVLLNVGISLAPHTQNTAANFVPGLCYRVI